MSARIDTCFAKLRDEGRAAVIPYIAWATRSRTPPSTSCWPWPPAART